MAKRQADLDGVVHRMLGLSGEEDGVLFTVTRGVTRPVWEPDAGTLALFALAKEVAARDGVVLTHGSAGGGSDGNFTGAMSIRPSTASASSARVFIPWTSTSSSTPCPGGRGCSRGC